MTLSDNDRETLYYLKGRVDSLYSMVETHLYRETSKDSRLRKIEKQIFAIWIVGPALSVLLGVGYGIKRFLF